MDKSGSLSALFSKYKSNSVRWPHEMEIFIMCMLSEIRSPLKIVRFCTEGGIASSDANCKICCIRTRHKSQGEQNENNACTD